MHAARQEVTVPLSEHEQQLLEQMEQALYAEDPKFASQMQGAGARAAARRRLASSASSASSPASPWCSSASTPPMWIGAVGFAVMVAAVAFALTPPRRKAALGAVQPRRHACGGPRAAKAQGQPKTRPARSWTGSRSAGSVAATSW